jgi:hypothetical protein
MYQKCACTFPTIRRITHLHNKRIQVLVIHRDAYFMTDLDATLTNTTSLVVLRNWLRLYEPAILNSIALVTDVALKHVKFLTQHFRVLQQSSRKPKPSHKQRTHLRQDPSRWKRRKKLPQIPSEKITTFFTSPPQTPRPTLP